MMNKDYHKQYYDNHKNEYWLKKVRCEVCNIDICKSTLQRHLKTIRHCEKVEMHKLTSIKPQIEKLIDDIELLKTRVDTMAV